MDWIAMVLSLIGAFLLSSKSKWGWFVNIIASAIWTAYGLWVVFSLPIVILNVIFVANAAIGFKNWGEGPKTKT